MNRLTKLTAVAWPAVLAATVAAGDPAPSDSQPVTPAAFGVRSPGAPPCDAPPAPGPSPYNIYCPPAVPGVPTPGQPPAPAPDQTTAPAAEPPSVAIAPESSGLALSGESVALALPNMAGSLSGVSYITTIFGRQTLLSQTSRQTFPAPFVVLAPSPNSPTGAPFPPQARLSNPVAIPVDVTTTVQALDTTIRTFDASRGTALIAENESPRPQTRFYARYQYFDGVPATGSQPISVSAQPAINDAALLAAVQAEIAAQNQIQASTGSPPILTTPAGAVRQLTNQVLPGLTPQQMTFINQQTRNRLVNREVFGFEAAFWDNSASVGLRVPTFQQSGDGSLGSDDFGDLSAILKAVIWEDRRTGDLLSGGLVVTAPTGPGLRTVDGTIRDVLLQPWLGAIHPFTPRLATQSFFGIIVPTDERDVTFLFSDVGLYYTLYRNNNPGAWLTALIPAAEAHVFTPLNHRGSQSSPVGLPDTVTMTGALQAILCNKLLVYGAVVVPVTGPKPFDVEAQAVVEYRF